MINGARKTRGCINSSVEPWAGMLQEGSQLNAGKTRERLSNLPQCSSGQVFWPCFRQKQPEPSQVPAGEPLMAASPRAPALGAGCGYGCVLPLLLLLLAGCWGHGHVLGWQLGGHCCLMCAYSTGDWEQCVWVGQGEAAGSATGAVGAFTSTAARLSALPPRLCSHRRERMLCSGWVKLVG